MSNDNIRESAIDGSTSVRSEDILVFNLVTM